MYSDDEKDNLTQSYGSGSGGISSSGGLNISNQNDSSSGSEFINQMEQVFKTIDTEENGVISLSQLRNEIEDITGETIDSNNPLIGKLLNFLRIVHRVEQQKDDDDDGNNENEDSDGSSFEDDNSFEDMELNERKQIEEENTFIDFQSFIESMASYMDGNDPKQVRLKQIEKLKLPKFKVPIELLKKYNITPKYLSPMINGSPNNSNNNGGGNNLLSPSNISGSGSGSTGNFSHLNSPTKNKFGRMFTPTKPIVTFDQFNTLITKLNYGKEIPKQKLLMHLHDLQTDTDDCIDANQFLSRFGGLNHPMSPKLTYDDDILEKKEDQFNINSRGGNTSPTHNLNHSSSGVSSPSVVQWKQNSQIVDQLQDSYKQLEKECESFQSEVSMLEKSRQIQEAALRKKDQEIDRLRKDARFADGMRDANKDLMVQNTNLKTQLSKLTQNEEFLRETMDQEKDRLRELNESNILKELEVKKLKLLLKTQQNINNKLSMMVTFSDDSLQDNGGGGSNIGNGGSVNFTSRRIKPTIDRAKQVLNRQKSDKFEIDKYSTIHANNNFSMFLQQQQLQQQQQALQQQQTSGANSPHSLQYEFEQLQQQQQQSNTPTLQSNTPTLQSELSNTSIDEGSELDSLKKQLSGFENGDFELPSDYDDSPIVDLNISSNNNSNTSFDSPNLISTTTTATTITSTSSPITSKLLERVSEGPQPIHMMSPISPNIISNNNNSNNQQTPVSPFKDRSLISSKYMGTSSPNIKSPSSAPMYSTPSSNSLLSPFNLNNSNNTVNTTSLSNTNSPIQSNNVLHNSGTNTIGRHNQVIHDQFNVGSIRRLKKSDIIRLHTSEMEEQNESAQLLITEAATALEEFKKNSSLELQRLQKLYQEEKQHNKILEKQLSLQLDKNKEMVTGKEGSSGTWGGMQNFFSFVSNYLPSTLFCNLSNTS